MKLPEFWKTGVAVLLLGGLAAYYWFVERKQEPRREGEREKVVALQLETAKAKQIDIVSSVQRVSLVKEGSDWKLVAPLSAPADKSAVDSMLTHLAKLEADEKVVEETSDAGQYGLASPSRTVTVTLEGAKDPAVVHFGEKAPDGSSVYARTGAGPAVYLVPSWIESAFDKKPFDLRDRDLLHVARDDVRSLEVTGPEGGFTLTRSDAGEWVFSKPLATRAGRWAVDGLLGTLENLRMEAIAAEQATDAKELARFGLAKPARTVNLVTKDGQTRGLEIGSPVAEPPAKTAAPAPPDGAKPTKVHARRAGSGLVAIVPATIADDLAKGMAGLRAKRLLEVATYETDSVEAVSGGTKKVYAKKLAKGDDGFDKTEWKRTAPDQKTLDTAKFEDALFKLGVDVAEFVDQPLAAPAYGLDAPLLKVTVKSARGESSVELAKKDGAYYARRSQDASVLKLEAAKAEELVQAFAGL